ncbi:MAG: hypothetical protein TR69_WS6001001296 [candidate division WS6 bacterium OLB20]|uniref:Uncharacterized protein n=1 Tax=candidate division WS6 bacterium OLB20 TaxID=1617426 RepID=A0A136LWH1_9BACT|nr:MAG: hypothetical protein TR69_WS6001001296 [candidate division WS6 bacterium OLB20]
MGQIILIGVISAAVAFLTTFVVKVNRDAKKITPEERERMKKNFDVTIDI